MNAQPTAADRPADLARIVEMNEALLLGAMRQHEMVEAEERLNEQLHHEITAREELGRELSEKARLLDLTNDAIVVRDFEDRITLWNQGAERLYGWGCEEVIGKDLHALLQTEFPRPKEEIIALLHREGQFVGEVVQVGKDGRSINSFCRWVLDRETESILTSYTDISARKRAEEALRESEERFRSLFASAPMGIFVCDREAVIQHYNRRAAELWGREPEAGVERHCGSVRLWLPDGRRLHHEESPIVGVLRTGVSAHNVEALIERPDGSRLPVLVSFAALINALGEITGAITSFIDITERRALEDSLITRAGDLVRADRTKDEFLAMLAHELRNPLAPIRNAAEILGSDGAAPEDRAQAERILARQIVNMTRMIDDLLDVSRITEGKIELRQQPTALADILTAAANLARPGIAARGQELVVTLPDAPIFLDADATRLEQVFGNLLTNARKYSAPGGHLALSAELAGDGLEAGEVVVRVRDDGMGIAPELLPHVFELFVQASRTLDRTHGGLGIGLTLVKRLVELHRGSVEAHSEGLGRGSEFIVRLPILPGSAPTPASLVPAPAREAGRRMLIVDDNEDSALSMELLQRRRGHQTRVAFTGPEAVTLAADFLPEVVLLDIGLPGMDGYEVARLLRAMPALDGVFIIAMSGYGRDEDRALAQEAGFDRYLVKPVDLDLLREWLSERGA